MIRALYFYFNKDPIATMELKVDSIDAQKGVQEGVIIRDEALQSAESAGNLTFVINNRERVMRGSAVAQIIDSAAAAQVQKELEKTNENLSDTQAKRSEFSPFYADSQNLNNEIKALIENDMYKYMGADVSSLSDLRSAVGNKLAQKNEMLSRENSESLKDIIESKFRYESELGKYIKNIYAGSSGLISYNTDGLENVFKIAGMTALTPQQILMKPDKIINRAGAAVSPGDPLFKVVASNRWYIAAYIDETLLIADETPPRQLEQGDVKKIYFTDDASASEESVVYYIGGDNLKPKSRLVIFELTRDILDYIDARNIKFRLNSAVRKGFKLPNTAIVARVAVKVPSDFVEDGFVYKAGQKTEKISLSTLPAPEAGYTYAIFDLSSLRAGDKIIIPESDKTDAFEINERDFIQLNGVYRANSGIARFCSVNMEDAVSSGGYTILSEELNPRLAPHDIIVVDSVNISENQILR
jgi:hypothetical protein